MRTILLTALAYGLLLGAARSDEVELITSSKGISATAAGHSSAPWFSDDGQLLFFYSAANNLVTNDDLHVVVDLFAYRASDESISLVTQSLVGTGGGNDDTYSASISSNAQFVAFASAADNLVAGDTNQLADVFLRDLVAGTTRLISKNWRGLAISGFSQRGLKFCESPLLSADGQRLVFESYAYDLTSWIDNNMGPDIFLCDLLTGQISFVSLNVRGTAPALGSSSQPSFSADGRWVAFMSTASDLTSTNTGTNKHICVRDLVAGTNYLASAAALSLPGTPGQCSNPALSSDGSTVVFKVDWSSFSLTLIMLYDVQSRQNIVVSSNAHGGVVPSISANGRFVVYNDQHDVFRWDRLSETDELVNVNSDATGASDQPAHWPSMTSDGRYIGFVSSATNLIAPPSNGRTHVYQRDMDTHTTTLVSRNIEGTLGNEDTDLMAPALHPAGHAVVFQTAARDLIPDDNNLATDIFLHEITPVTTRLISRSHTNRPSAGPVSFPYLSWQPVDAQNNRTVFTAADYARLDTNRFPDIFLRDRTLDVIAPLSVDTIDFTPTAQPHFQSTGPTYHASISTNGRYVVYMQSDQSRRGTLIEPYTPGTVVWLDLQTGERRLLDNEPGQPPGIFPGRSHVANLSNDGKRIVFYNGETSGRTLVVRNLENSTADWKTQSVQVAHSPQLFVRFTPNTEWVLYINAGKLIAWNLATDEVRELEAEARGLADPLHPDIAVSADSRYVLSTRTNDAMFRHDLTGPAAAGALVCQECRMPAVSADGRILAYLTRWKELVVKDLDTGQTNSLSLIQPGSVAVDVPYGPIVSHDGRYVCYASPPSRELGEQDHRANEMFVHDRFTQFTCRLLDDQRDSSKTMRASGSQVLAPDGRTILFISFHPALLENDYNDSADIFMVRLGSGDSDADGLDDQWELTYFETLDRDGSGDFDQDGMSDLGEYISGTNPTDDDSLLEVSIKIEGAFNDVTVFWQSVPGKIYQVEYKDSLLDPWTPTRAPLVATTTVTTFRESARISRFHRVRAQR